MMAYLHRKSRSTLEFIVGQFAQREQAGSNPAFNAWPTYHVLVPPKFDTTSDFPTPLTAHKSFQIKRLGAFDALN